MATIEILMVLTCIPRSLKSRILTKTILLSKIDGVYWISAKKRVLITGVRVLQERVLQGSEF